ncbi:MAG: hypothetical protein JXR29_08815 [Methylothermaceae bacterium]|nr:hypothetical protein [Methylothermaceae bacterium]
MSDERVSEGQVGEEKEKDYFWFYVAALAAAAVAVIILVKISESDKYEGIQKLEDEEIQQLNIRVLN